MMPPFGKDGRWPSRAAAIVVAALAISALFAETGISARKPTEHMIEIRDFAFVPGSLRVRPGDRITWINRDIAPHTVTATDETWDSGELAQGDVFTHTIEVGQTGRYFCRFHPSMKAKLDISRD